jgi:hypothetical protein
MSARPPEEFLFFEAIPYRRGRPSVGDPVGHRRTLASIKKTRPIFFQKALAAKLLLCFRNITFDTFFVGLVAKPENASLGADRERRPSKKGNAGADSR